MVSKFRREIEKYPDEPKLFIYGMFVQAAKKIPGTKFLNELLFRVTPDLPFSLWENLVVRHRWPLFWVGYWTTFIFCFGITALLTLLEGTWSQGSFENLVAFSQDRMNLFFYIILNPIIVGLSLILWVEAARTWRNTQLPITIADTGEHRSSAASDSPQHFVRLFISVNLVLVISTLAISNYMADVSNSGGLFNLNPAGLQHRYWFLGAPEAEGLRPITVHYMFINFLLLVNTLVTIGFFITAARPIVRLANQFDNMSIEISFAKLKDRVAPFINVYLYAKLLVTLHIVHVWVWSWSEDLSSTENKLIEIAFLTVIGVFFIAIPRYHLESEWYRLQLKKLRGTERGPIEHDVRDRYTRLAVHLLDTLIIGGFILSWFPPPGNW